MAALGEPLLKDLDDVERKLTTHNKERIAYGLSAVREIPLPPPDCFSSADAPPSRGSSDDEGTADDGAPARPSLAGGAGRGPDGGSVPDEEGDDDVSLPMDTA
eukprot:CAMPEP_0194291614 /NCGR_PEP_ID=MMETSP0169-20130528/43747_1 /TAXON_ID=218684 /ORGANISM="Corethron pennatum, Strain L29A3" /LENGTH=102 /DNA_ID=CAMNT_0039039549 /DNA_START=234 /DNA_END=538 /DNA_ORIENTATION=+